MNGANHSLAYADTNLVGENARTYERTTKKNAETLLNVRKEIKAGKTKYVFTSRYRHQEQNMNIKMAIKLFENLA